MGPDGFSLGFFQGCQFSMKGIYWIFSLFFIIAGFLTQGSTQPSLQWFLTTLLPIGLIILGLLAWSLFCTRSWLRCSLSVSWLCYKKWLHLCRELFWKRQLLDVVLIENYFGVWKFQIWRNGFKSNFDEAHDHVDWDEFHLT